MLLGGNAKKYNASKRSRFAFAFVGILMLISQELSRRLTFGRVHGSAIAILIVWGWLIGGHRPEIKGLARCKDFAGLG